MKHLIAVSLMTAGCAASNAPPPATASSDGVQWDNLSCGTARAESCGNARDDNCNGVIDEGCGLTTGLVQFVVAWSTPDADIDLLVTDPNGELIEVGTLPASGLIKERDCPGRRGECGGKNAENIFLEPTQDLLRGVYSVRIRLEGRGRGGEPISVYFGARMGPKTHAARFSFITVEQEESFQLTL